MFLFNLFINVKNVWFMYKLYVVDILIFLFLFNWIWNLIIVWLKVINDFIISNLLIKSSKL